MTEVAFARWLCISTAMAIKDHKIGVWITNPMRNSSPIFVIESDGCRLETSRLAVQLHIALACLCSQVPGICNGEVLKHMSNSSVEDIFVQCRCSCRSKWIRHDPRYCGRSYVPISVRSIACTRLLTGIYHHPGNAQVVCRGSR